MVATAVEPRYSDTDSLLLYLTISDTTAYCEVNLTGSYGTKSITNGHLTLTDSSGTTVGDWPNLSSPNSKLVISKTVKELKRGETYTLTFSAYVNKDGKSEYISDSLSKTCPRK